MAGESMVAFGVSALGSQVRTILPVRLTGVTLSNPQDLGYPLELGYQNFLYPSEPDLRDLLLFLAERLPTDASEDADQSAGMGRLGCDGSEGEGVVGLEKRGRGEKFGGGGVCVLGRAKWEDWGGEGDTGHGEGTGAWADPGGELVLEGSCGLTSCLACPHSNHTGLSDAPQTHQATPALGPLHLLAYSPRYLLSWFTPLPLGVSCSCVT